MSPTYPDAAYDLKQLPPPDEIHGIEIFAGGASVPARYAGVSGRATPITG